MRYGKLPKFNDKPIMSLEDIGKAMGMSITFVSEVLHRFKNDFDADLSHSCRALTEDQKN